MKRSPMPPRKAYMARTPMKRANPTRRASEFARCYHSRERVRWIKARRCVACFGSPSDNAHIEGDGAHHKAAYTKIVPVCRRCHAALHQYGRAWFERTFFLDLAQLAAETNAEWERAA